VKRAIDVGPFGELADPRVLADLAARAEDRGWDGFFLWNHISYLGPWERAGLTWAVTDFGVQPTEAGVRAVIEAGPGR